MFLDPKNFVSENKADLNDYICPLCNGILFKPVSDKCSHFFCKKCVVSYIKTHKFCPLDKFKELDILKDAPMVERIINNKYIMCKYISYGCSWKGKVKQYQNHLKECEYIDKKISKEKEEISFKKDNIKDNDDSLKFVILTGVPKFSKVSLFSGLNNLNDITLNANYADICGYTQTELEHEFAEYFISERWRPQFFIVFNVFFHHF